MATSWRNLFGATETEAKAIGGVPYTKPVSGNPGSAVLAKGAAYDAYLAGASAPKVASLSAWFDLVVGSTQGSLLHEGASAFDDLAPSATTEQTLRSAGTTTVPAYGWVHDRDGKAEVGTSDLSTGCYRGPPAVCPSSGLYYKNYIYLTPIVLGAPNTAVRIGIYVTSTYTSGVCRLGIYSVTSPDSTMPKTLLVDSGEITTTSTGKREATISTALGSGLYWLAFSGSSSDASMAVGATAASSVLGWKGTTFTSNIDGLAMVTTYGALPSTLSSWSFSYAGVPAVALRF